MIQGYKKFIFILGLSLLISPIISYAQIGGFGLDQATHNVSITMSPEHPQPGESITIDIESFTVDLDRATITWKQGNTVLKKGTGIKEVSVTAGKAGTTSTITATITTADGVTTEKTITIRPAVVDLVWQTRSYTPPFYKGKALYGHQDLVNIVALPNLMDSNGKPIDPKNLVYTWKKDDVVLGDISGFGKNTMSFVGSIIARPVDIQVEVGTLNGDTTASGETFISIAEPKVVMYENNPLYGIHYEDALSGTATLSGKELSISAIPYFFDTTDKNSYALNYTWSMNGNAVDNNQNNPSTLVVRQTGDTGGVSNISLNVENANKLIESSQDSTSLTFGKDSSLPIGF